MELTDILLKIVQFFPIFLFALTVHEAAHALAANWGGDLTATYQNRLSLNPIRHIDPLGTIVFPLIPILFSPSFALFGWAKPVPVDEAKFRDKAWNVVVSMAGPFSNLLLVVFGALLIEVAHNGYVFGVEREWWDLNMGLWRSFAHLAYMYIVLNWVLCVFNLMPIPPLDGSHVLYHFFVRGRGHLYAAWDAYQRFGILVLILVVQIPFLGKVIDPLMTLSLRLLAPNFAETAGLG